MSAVEWYRCAESPEQSPSVRPSISRRVRNFGRGLLPDPDVRGKTMVLYARQGLRRSTAWAGMFSEFHAVIGALAYAEAQGAAALRVDFRSALYVDRDRGPNWWRYFFEHDVMPVTSEPPRGDVHLDRPLAKYGRYGGFCDLVNGGTPYLYPMTFGVSRREVHRLVSTYIQVRGDIAGDIEARIRAAFDPGAYVVGVHYRGTDSAHGVLGRLNDANMHRIPYRAYADEVRRVLDAAAPGRHQIAVATDEREYLEFMRREFGQPVVWLEDVARSSAKGPPIHFDARLPASNYEKGRAGLFDCLLLSACSYLVKGRSNLSDASLAFNARLPYSFCLGMRPSTSSG
jgi:hypothetical protein